MKRLAGWILSAPAIVAVVGILIFPVGAVIATTFMDPRGTFAPYASFFNSGFRTTVLFRTLQIAALTTAISLIFGFITAYVVSRAPARLRSLLIVAAVFPLLTGVVVRAFAWLVILGRNGILNNTLVGLGITDEPVAMLYTQGAVIVGMVYLFVPLMILTLVGVLENIPEDILQASSSLGANPAATFWQVLMPLAVPGLIVGAVLVFTGSFTAYATPQLLGGERQTVLATLLQQRAMVSFDWVGASTIAAIMTAITISVVLVMTRTARRLNPMTT
ncbi:MAG TPA: ABC transporter permease [Microvirga sp.]|nr:ABC transporter permease [Microvirga sp.]